jgi:hypothetical protein
MYFLSVLDSICFAPSGISVQNGRNLWSFLFIVLPQNSGLCLTFAIYLKGEIT